MEETRKCTGPCGLVKSLTQFGTQYNKLKDGTRSVSYRKMCKSCRNGQENAAAGAKSVDPNAIPRPTICTNPDCPCAPGELDFPWNKPRNTWRKVCKVCTAKLAVVGECSSRSRSKRKAADPITYLAHNKEVHTAWKEKNPEKCKEYKEKYEASSSSRIKRLVNYLRQKYGKDDMDLPIVWAEMDQLEELMTQPCHYCSHLPLEGQKVNGLDRVEPGGLYSLANAAPCCGACNAMKLNYTLDEFLNGIRAIVRHCQLEDHLANCPMPVFGGTRDRREASEKTKRMELTLDDKIEMWSSPCYLCGRGPALGIDRVDATGNYTLDNSRSCCTQCNYMKKDYDLQEFKDHVVRIFNHTAQWVAGDVSTVLTAIGTRKPVAVFTPDRQQLMVFPSVSCAARTAQVHKKKIHAAIQCERCYAGHYWGYAPVADYRSQQLDVDWCRAAFKRLRAASQ